MAVQSTNGLSSAKALQDQLLCPVLLEPLSEAVSLVPCAHKVQYAVAEQIFGTTNGGWLVSSNKPCPVCRVCVLGYMADHTTRNIVKSLFELPENDLNEMLAAMKKKLAEKSKTVEKDVLVDVPYPGKAARFVHRSGNWSLFSLKEGTLCRSMTFISTTKDSLLKEFSLLGYKSGGVVIEVQFSEHSTGVEEYFKKFDIILEWGYLAHGYLSGNKDQLRIIFNIIAENNEIPESYFNTIKDIVAKGTH